MCVETILPVLASVLCSKVSHLMGEVIHGDYRRQPQRAPFRHQLRGMEGAMVEPCGSQLLRDCVLARAAVRPAGHLPGFAPLQLRRQSRCESRPFSRQVTHETVVVAVNGAASEATMALQLPDISCADLPDLLNPPARFALRTAARGSTCRARLGARTANPT
jgi:hypothetical protein